MFFSFHKHFSYKREDYVPNDKWHINCENYEEYCPKYINYYEDLISDIKNECEVTKTVNQYVVDNNEYKSYIFDVSFYSGENLYVEVYSGGFFSLRFNKNNSTLEEAKNINEQYLNIIYEICVFSVYNIPLEKNTITSAIQIESKYDEWLYWYSNQWHFNTLYPNEITIGAKKINEDEYNVRIYVNGYLTDENVWP